MCLSSNSYLLLNRGFRVCFECGVSTIYLLILYDNTGLNLVKPNNYVVRKMCFYCTNHMEKQGNVYLPIQTLLHEGNKR